jgi:hypothetical protein
MLRVWRPIGWLMAFVVLFDLSYCHIIAEYSGLDPSWINGLTHASELHLLFGHDIVFTYGPLGYFLAGAKTPESFRHIFAARVGMAFAFSGSIVWFCAALSLRRFLISIAATVAAMVLGEDHVAGVVGAFVAAAALILDRRSTRQGPEALVIGVLAGIGAMTKFTVGVQCLVAIGSVLVFGAIEEARARSNGFSNRRSLGIFLVSAIATMSAVLKASGSSDGAVIFVVFGLWLLCVVALVATIAYADGHAKRSSAAFTISAVLAIALLFLSNTIEFVRNSLQISSGYSDAMISVPAGGGASEAALGVLILGLIATVGFLERPALSLGAVFGLVVLGWLNFKEGYVREDHPHIVEFLIPVLFIFGLLTAAARSRRVLALSLLAFAAVFFSTVAEMLPTAAVQNFALSRFSAPFGEFVDAFGPWPEGSEPLRGMAGDVLDAQSVSKLSSLPIDVEPAEATVAFANGLAWSPEPVFQSYSAYTPALDRLNAKALATGHRRVLVDAVTIDGRDFMEESPLARRALLCAYGLDPQFDQSLAQVQRGERFAVLSFLPSKRCRSGGVRSIGAIAWDKEYALPASAPGSMTFLALQIRYSLRGSLVKTAFRGPLVTISIRDRNGAVISYRLLTQNATNGFLISPNPLSTADFARLVAGKLPATTATFSIHTDDPGAYRDDMEASFENVTFAQN